MMKTLFERYIDNDDGGGAVEYALVLLLALSVVSIASRGLKTQVSGMMLSVGSKLNSGVNLIN
jgi:Flp pilus assembly pilin Flp